MIKIDDWVIEKVHSPAVPRQYESSRLNIDYTITSKRKLRKLVEGNHVNGWDDPRMPTVVGMRRRGFTAEGLRDFCKRVGVSKSDGIVDVAMLEYCIRQSLENTAARGMAVLNPLKVTLTNLPEAMDLAHARHPNVDMGERIIPLTSEIYIDRKDFEEVAPKGFKRLIPDGEVRLRHAYVIKCDEVIKDENGEVVELKCSIDPETLGKNPEGRKVKGVIHWVSAEKGIAAEVRIYDRLFTESDPEVGDDFLANLNPESLQVLQAVIEPALAQAQPEDRFERIVGRHVVQREEDGVATRVESRQIVQRDAMGRRFYLHEEGQSEPVGQDLTLTIDMQMQFFVEEAVARTVREYDARWGGALVVDEGAAAKLRHEGKSLLPIGMTAVEGDFSRGDVIAVRDHGGAEIARGLANYASSEARLLCRHASSEIERLLGYTAEPEMVHRDNMVVHGH